MDKNVLERFFLPVRHNGWLIKDFFEPRLLLNHVPVFHENLFKIRCGWIVSCNKRQNLFSLFSFDAKSLFSVTELNFSQSFLNEC